MNAMEATGMTHCATAVGNQSTVISRSSLITDSKLKPPQANAKKNVMVRHSEVTKVNVRV